MAAPTPERGGKRRREYPEEVFVAARAMYEGTPGMTFAKLAEETGLGKSTLERRANEEGWRKNPLLVKTNLSEQAQEVADRFAGKIAEYGDEISAEQKAAAVAETVQETAVIERGKVIDRHRREWAAPRKLAYDGVQKRDFETLKLARIAADVLTLIQNGERRCWQLDQPAEADSKNTVVVIERE